KVIQRGHQHLTTFGIGKELKEQQWRSLVRQLLTRGLLEIDLQGFGGLRLTEQCRTVLRGEEVLALRVDTVVASRDERARPKRAELPEALEPLWHALRDCRKRLAETQGIAPFMV